MSDLKINRTSGDTSTTLKYPRNHIRYDPILLTGVVELQDRIHEIFRDRPIWGLELRAVSLATEKGGQMDRHPGSVVGDMSVRRQRLYDVWKEMAVPSPVQDKRRS